jgi:hypothetical protein
MAVQPGNDDASVNPLPIETNTQLGSHAAADVTSQASEYAIAADVLFAQYHRTSNCLPSAEPNDPLGGSETIVDVLLEEYDELCTELVGARG